MSWSELLKNSPITFPMKYLAPLSILLALLLTGCGPTIKGRYEMHVDVPRMSVPNADPKLQRQLENAMSQAANLNHAFLDFDGRKVRMGSAFVETEHSYRVKGSKLEVIVEGMGQKGVLPMAIDVDGSIIYMGMRYKRVR